MSDPILAAVSGNPRLLARVRDALARQTPVLLANIQSALERTDAQALYQAAHKLKGSVSNFPGADAIEIASSLESAATAADFDRARSLVSQLEAALEDLMKRVDAELGAAPHP